VRPTGFTREFDFFGTQRFAKYLGRVGAVRRTLPMWVLQMISVGGGFLASRMAADTTAACTCRSTDDVPAVVGLKRIAVLSMNQGSTWPSIENAVVVVQGNQLVQLPGAGQRGGFVVDAPSGQPSPEGVGGGPPRCTSRLNSQQLSASAMPTALVMPWPSGPVVT
jgi:hypothetical protein